MIPCYELRIGNYVLAEQTMQRISMIDYTSSSTTAILFSKKTETATNKQHELESLQPVLLNDTILQECGFVYHTYFKFWQLLKGQDENRSEMDIDPDYNIIDFMRKPIIKKVA